MRLFRFFSASAAAALVAAALPAQAMVVNFNFTGSITASQQTGMSDNSYVGQAFDGMFSYDTDAVPSVTGYQDIYPNALHLTLNSPLGTAEGDGYINVLHNYNNRGTDEFEFVAYPTTGNFNLLIGSTQPVATPPDAPLPTSFNGLDFAFSAFGSDRSFSGTFEATPAIAAAAPEPASWATTLLGFGLAGTALRRRRQIVPARLSAC